MSVREAKGRLLSREYMADREFMTEYDAAEREWYLLTALFADDAGFLPWDPPDNAANLYRYEVPSEREERVAGYVAHFTATGRFIDLGCGHALMPRGPAKRPRGHRREFAVKEEHSQCIGNALETAGELSASYPVQSSPVNSSPVEIGVSRNIRARESSTRGAPGPENPVGKERANGGFAEFALEAGGFVAELARASPGMALHASLDARAADAPEDAS